MRPNWLHRASQSASEGPVGHIRSRGEFHEAGKMRRRLGRIWLTMRATTTEDRSGTRPTVQRLWWQQHRSKRWGWWYKKRVRVVLLLKDNIIRITHKKQLKKIRNRKSGIRNRNSTILPLAFRKPQYTFAVVEPVDAGLTIRTGSTVNVTTQFINLTY